MYIILSMLLFAIPGLSKQFVAKGYDYYAAPYALPITQIALTGSVYCTMGISVERYLTVCRPFYSASHNWSAKRYIIPILLFSLGYNFPRFFELHTKLICPEQVEDGGNHLNDTSAAELNMTQQGSEQPIMQISEASETINAPYPMCIKNDSYGNGTEDVDLVPSLELTELRMNIYYYSIYTVGSNFVFMGIGPFTLLIALTTLTLKRLIEYSRESNEIRVVQYPRQHTVQEDSTSVALLTTVTTNQPNDVLAPYSRTNSKISQDISRPSFADISRPSFAITKRLKTNEIMLAKVGLLISFVFIVSHSIRWIPNIYELIQRMQNRGQGVYWPEWIEMFTQFSHLLTVFNASVNFYIYYFTRYQITSINCFRHRNSLDNTHNTPSHM